MSITWQQIDRPDGIIWRSPIGVHQNSGEPYPTLYQIGLHLKTARLYVVEGRDASAIDRYVGYIQTLLDPEADEGENDAELVLMEDSLRKSKAFVEETWLSEQIEVRG